MNICGRLSKRKVKKMAKVTVTLDTETKVTALTINDVEVVNADGFSVDKWVYYGDDDKREEHISFGYSMISEVDGMRERRSFNWSSEASTAEIEEKTVTDSEAAEALGEILTR